ncbi:MAG TPA: AAA family ATPase [Acidimicrobiales bacterium]|nr:AAA family ATPase [Acidimicrobiales bacterium]
MQESGGLYGREQELRLLASRLESVVEGGSVVLVEGQAGIGKSLLLSNIVDIARSLGFTVLRAVGVQSEAHLAFSGLHQLIRPILSGAQALPRPQREALLAAFGLTDEAAPDFFRIALACLELIADAAAHSPVLIVAEDIHWMDKPTTDVLSFIARRIGHEPILLFSSIRSGYESPMKDAEPTEIHVAGLTQEHANALLDRYFPDLDPAVRSRVLTEAAGNPLALLELPRVINFGTETATSGAVIVPLTRRLEDAFAGRIADLPEVTQKTLLVAALDDHSELAEVLDAASGLLGQPVVEEDLLPAAATGLIDLDDGMVGFRHPLMRSAIYQEASPLERRLAHGALSNALTRDPDRQVWHRAASTVGKDIEVALDLEAAAQRARRRGAIPIAISALERAQDATPDVSKLGIYSLLIAEMSFDLGRHEDADRLLRDAESRTISPAERAQIAWLRELSVLQPLDESGVYELVQLAEERSADGDTDLALHLLFAAARRCFWYDPGYDARMEIVSIAERLPVPDDHPEFLAVLGNAAPVERGEQVFERLQATQLSSITDPAMVRVLGITASAFGAFEMAEQFLSSSVAGLRSQGRFSFLAQTLEAQAHAALFVGNWSLATRSAEEAARLARETGRIRWLCGALATNALLAAYRGDRAELESSASEVESLLLAFSFNSNLTLLELARGVSAMALGLHAEAYDHLIRVFTPGDPSYHPFNRHWAIADLADAAAHTGNKDVPRRLMADLIEIGARTPAPTLHINLQFADAVLADDAEAESAFLSGLENEALNRRPFMRGRLLLAYGEWLRRHHRMVDSRRPLRAAREIFDALGAEPWGERARSELRASGESSRRRGESSIDQLTPQELQIAHMVAEGLSNREIAEQLYLSHRTVGAHLYRIFPKLSITSRSQMRGALMKADA